MKYWYVEVPITEGTYCKRFDTYEDARKEVARIRDACYKCEIPNLKGYATEVSVASWKACAVIRPEKIIDCSGAELQVGRIKEENE